jgi:hypothetical protein
MDKLLVFLILLFGLHYAYKIKMIHFPNEKLFREANNLKKPSVVEYFDIISNPSNATLYKKMDLIQDKSLSCLHGLLSVLKKQSKFISFAYNNKPLIGIFACSTHSLSRMLDHMQHTQQDFLDERLPNGLFLFYLMYRPKKTLDSKENIKYLFSELVAEIIVQCKTSIFDNFCVPNSRIQYILFPIENYTLNDPVVQVLYENGFLKTNHRFDKIIFFKKYITYPTT